MPREYRHIKNYKKEIINLRKQGLTQREIAAKFGFTKEQVKFFQKRTMKSSEARNRNSLKKRGLPLKNYVVTVQDKVNELKYILTRKKQR